MNFTYMRLIRYLILKFATFGLCAEAGAASTTLMRVGTLAPTGTNVHRRLQDLGEEWRRKSDGAVNMQIFADGRAGGESQMVKYIDIGRLQGALLTAVGLSGIDAGIQGLQSIPMAFRSLEEVEYVGARLHPELEERLRDKGYVVLFWVDAGWVRFFSNRPFSTPEELRKMSLFSWAGSNDQERIYRSAGFRPVSLETADLVLGMSNGMIEVAAMPPFYAMGIQLNTRAPNMLELNWAPLVGAFVVSRKTWDALPPDVRDMMRSTGTAAGREITRISRKESDEAVARMQSVSRPRLNVIRIDPKTETAWRRAAEDVYPEIRGSFVPADIFDATISYLDEFRTRQGN